MKTVKIKKSGESKALPSWVADTLIRRGEATVVKPAKAVKVVAAKPMESKAEEKPADLGKAESKAAPKAPETKAAKKVLDDKELKAKKDDKDLKPKKEDK